MSSSSSDRVTRSQHKRHIQTLVNHSDLFGEQVATKKRRAAITAVTVGTTTTAGVSDGEGDVNAHAENHHSPHVGEASFNPMAVKLEATQLLMGICSEPSLCWFLIDVTSVNGFSIQVIHPKRGPIHSLTWREIEKFDKEGLDERGCYQWRDGLYYNSYLDKRLVDLTVELELDQDDFDNGASPFYGLLCLATHHFASLTGVRMWTGYDNGCGLVEHDSISMNCNSKVLYWDTVSRLLAAPRTGHVQRQDPLTVQLKQSANVLEQTLELLSTSPLTLDLSDWTDLTRMTTNRIDSDVKRLLASHGHGVSTMEKAALAIIETELLERLDPTEHSPSSDLVEETWRFLHMPLGSSPWIVQSWVDRKLHSSSDGLSLLGAYALHRMENHNSRAG